MAKVRANASGNWSSNNTGIWEVYDENTNTWSAYGQNPTENDDVYHNGYDLTLMMSVNVKSITNREDTNIVVSGGGHLIWNNEYTFTTNKADYLMSGSSPAFSFPVNSSTTNCYLICPTIRLEGGVCFIHTYGNNAGFEVTGNIYIKNASLANSGYGIYTHKLSVNGNIIGEGVNYFVKSYSSYNNAGWDFLINGNCKLVGDDKVNNLGRTRITITGCYRGLDNINLSFAQTTSAITLGSIEYYSTNHTYGFFAVDANNKFASSWGFTILNPLTFTWKDVTEPRSNPFIIVTDADINNRQQYPPEDEVKEGTEYVWGQRVGTYLPDYPPESVVLQGYEYDNGDMVGNMAMAAQVGCVTKEDVREGVPLLGMGEVGTLVVPSVDDVREGVVFDNGSVGTLIVKGGGDRLRIADFGYYTNAQSDTYIVDLTEQDKPKFAVAEERVLIEMFPELDLDNIPEKYFDDLFVKYLKYRLIVEYYRTAGINSTFTPSEPTTEIVNYQNVRNEIWLNSANIYLKAWAKKYPESITKPQRILL